MEVCFDGLSESVSYFLVAVDKFLGCWGYQFANEEEVIEYISSRLDGNATPWNVDLYRLGGPELVLLLLFLWALWAQFGAPALRENARTPP